MATEYKVLGQISSASPDVPISAYTAPYGKEVVISTVTLCNQGLSAVTVRVAIHHASEPISTKHYLVYDSVIGANDTLSLTLGITMDDGYSVSFSSSLATVSCNVFGAEIDSVDPYEYVRPADWKTITPASTGVEKFQGLYAVFNNASNFIAFSATGNYTVDWGDGGATENVSSGVTALHNYVYANVSGPVVGSSVIYNITFTDSTDTVNWVGHGLENGTIVSFSSISTTTGISTDTFYYVVGKTADTFQLSDTLGGTAKSLTNNGTGELYFPKYKTALVTITPNGGTLATINLNKRHTGNTATTYNTGWLEMDINGPNLTSLVIGASSQLVAFNLLESFSLRENLVADFSYMFSEAISLRHFPSFNTSSATSFSRMFQFGYGGLKRCPHIDASKVTNFSYMFFYCTSLVEVPLLDTSEGTDFSNMFFACHILETVPTLNTSKATTVASMFAYCAALRSPPLLDTSESLSHSGMFTSCTDMEYAPLLDTGKSLNCSSMFQGCVSLRELPLLNTSSVTNFSTMLTGCKLIVEIPLLDTHLGTTFNSMFSSCTGLCKVPALIVTAGTSFTNMFSGCIALKSVEIVGAAFNISVSNCMLSSAALDALYTNLASGVVAKTVTVSSNWGTTGDTPSIATSKGWTVTG